MLTEPFLISKHDFLFEPIKSHVLEKPDKLWDAILLELKSGAKYGSIIINTQTFIFSVP